MAPVTLQSTKCQNCGAEMVETLDGSFTCSHCGSVFRAGQPNNTLLSGQAGITSTVQPDPPIPRDIALGYDKKKHWHPLLWGVIVWLIYGLLRVMFTAYLFENAVQVSAIINNPFVSPVGGLFWFIRTALLLGALPAIIYMRRKQRNKIWLMSQQKPD
ncbi:MAG TPA: hypothetical protein VFE53_16205 [Mucilaginibacter sp.]|jgi:hypothetical protein|nr:hypothetical protein [Mucilaginibacter sp.]